MYKGLLVKKGNNDWFSKEALIQFSEEVEVSCPCCGGNFLSKRRVLGGAAAVLCSRCGYGDRIDQIVKAPVFITIQTHISKLRTKVLEAEKVLEDSQRKLGLCRQPEAKV